MNRRDFLHRTITAAGLGTAAFAPQAFGLGERARLGQATAPNRTVLTGKVSNANPRLPRLARRLQSGHDHWSHCAGQ